MGDEQIKQLETREIAHSGRLKVNITSIISAVTILGFLAAMYFGILQHSDARTQAITQTSEEAVQSADKAAEKAENSAKQQQRILDILSYHSESIKELKEDVHDMRDEMHQVYRAKFPNRITDSQP